MHEIQQENQHFRFSELSRNRLSQDQLEVVRTSVDVREEEARQLVQVKDAIFRQATEAKFQAKQMRTHIFAQNSMRWLDRELREVDTFRASGAESLTDDDGTADDGVEEELEETFVPSRLSCRDSSALLLDHDSDASGHSNEGVDSEEEGQMPEDDDEHDQQSDQKDHKSIAKFTKFNTVIGYASVLALGVFLVVAIIGLCYQSLKVCVISLNIWSVLSLLIGGRQ